MATSLLRGERCSSPSNTFTGRKFAYSPKCLRMPKMPDSTRFSRGTLFQGWSPTGPPAEPIRTASLPAQTSFVSSGNGWAVALERAPTERETAVLELEPVILRNNVQNVYGRVDDLRPDEVAGQNGDVVGFSHDFLLPV